MYVHMTTNVLGGDAHIYWQALSVHATRIDIALHRLFRLYFLLSALIEMRWDQLIELAYMSGSAAFACTYVS